MANGQAPLTRWGFFFPPMTSYSSWLDESSDDLDPDELIEEQLEHLL